MNLAPKGQTFSIVTVAIAGLCFMGLALQLTLHARERLLRAESIAIAKRWHDGLDTSGGTLERLFTAERSETQAMLPPGDNRLSGIFHFQIRDISRGQVYRSFNTFAGWRSEIEKIAPSAQADKAAFAALRAEIVAGRPPEWPEVYSKVVLPLVQSGRRVGSIIVYADQTERSALYKQSFGFLTSGLLILMAFGSALAGMIITRKIREYQTAENRVRYLAHHDSLTGSLNRASFNDALEKALAHPPDLEGDRKCPVLMWVDLDRFKDVNDSFGHAIGDALLKYVAEKLQESVEDGDVVARVGGDEFAILCMSPRSRAQLEDMARNICDRLNTFVCLDGQFVPCGACIGIAPYPDAGTSAIQLVRAADLAMYKAKTNGRHGYRFYAAVMQEEVKARREMEQALINAVENAEFELHYQPQVNLDTKDVEVYEALIRWNRPEKGLVPPADFIYIAEEIGLIKRLGEWVLLQACSDAADWSGGERVAVNLSAAQFKDNHIVDAVSKALAASGLAPGRLELEITESLLFHDPEKALGTLSTLKALGVKVAMDDFGTGYSSLAHLWRFPFDKIKIDRSFVKNIDHNPKVSKIITSIIDLGRSLDIAITAEGVEHEYQEKFLRGRSCELVQGYFYGRPAPNEELQSFVRQIGISDHEALLPQLLSIMKKVESAQSLSPEAGIEILDALVRLAKATDEDGRKAEPSGKPERPAASA